MGNMFFGTSLTSSLVKSQDGGLSPMNEELQENISFSGWIKKKKSQKVILCSSFQSFTQNLVHVFIYQSVFLK